MVKSPLSDVDLLRIPVTEMVFSVMEQQPDDHIAMVDGVTEEKYTYARTLTLMKTVASGLTRLGVKRGDVLAMLSPNSPDYSIMFFATLACGATVTPINPVYTEYEIAKQLEDSGATFVFANMDTVKKAIGAGQKSKRSKKYIVSGSYPNCTSLSVLTSDAGTSYPGPLTDIDVQQHVAVIPYSSGTTGVPKGVMLTHFNIVSQILQLSHPDSAPPGLDTNIKAVVMGFLPFFHVYGMFAVMLATLIKGATSIIMPRFQPERFLQLVEKYKVTYIPAAPPVILFLAKSPLVKKYDLSSVTNIGSGGAPLSREMEAEALENTRAPEVSQGFGMTETTLACLSPLGFRPLRPGSVGVPIPNCEVQIVDPSSGAVLGPHQRGELWVRGPNIMKGYLNRPQATRDTLDEQGWLHTGDIGYHDNDGFFYLVDRIKELIKYKAFQVAPAELEALLLTNAKISDVAVIGVPDDEAGELPRAFVVKKYGHNITEQEVKKYVADHVSSFKHLRGGVEFVPIIPKSDSGKILRRQLKDRVMNSKL